MVSNNTDIRKSIEEAGLFYWQVALEYGLNDGNFSRMLRKELSKGEKEKILTIIQGLKCKKEIN